VVEELAAEEAPEEAGTASSKAAIGADEALELAAAEELGGALVRAAAAVKLSLELKASFATLLLHHNGSRMVLSNSASSSVDMHR
jgi:hypothetical protein